MSAALTRWREARAYTPEVSAPKAGPQRSHSQRSFDFLETAPHYSTLAGPLPAAEGPERAPATRLREGPSGAGPRTCCPLSVSEVDAVREGKPWDLRAR